MSGETDEQDGMGRRTTNSRMVSVRIVPKTRPRRQTTLHETESLTFRVKEKRKFRNGLVVVE